MKKTGGLLFLMLILLASTVWAEAIFEDGQGRQLTNDEFKRGEAQLEQMIKDRPLMATYVHKGDALWTWTARQFGGQFLPAGIEWDSRHPDWNAISRFNGNIDPALNKNYKGSIFVRPDYIGADVGAGPQPTSGLKSGCVMWLEAVFELFNLRNRDRGIAVMRRALCGQSNRESFVVEMALVEAGVQSKIKNFIDNLWLPQCKKYNLPSSDPNFNLDNIKIQNPEEIVNHILTKKEAHPYWENMSKQFDDFNSKGLKQGGCGEASGKKN